MTCESGAVDVGGSIRVLITVATDPSLDSVVNGPSGGVPGALPPTGGEWPVVLALWGVVLAVSGTLLYVGRGLIEQRRRGRLRDG